MTLLTFSLHKKILLTFQVEELSIVPQPEGILLKVRGNIERQEPEWLSMLEAGRQLHVKLEKEEEAVLDGIFLVTCFTFEPEELVALLN